MSEPSSHETWSSPRGFLLVCIGAAVGLGNIWLFPYLAGKNGGGAFVLLYLLFVLCISMPIMMAEIAVGRYGRQSAVRSIARIAREEGGSKYWRFFPWLSISMNLLALTFYAVVACLSLAYVFKIANVLRGGDVAAATNATYDQLVGNPWELMGWYSLLMFLTMLIVARGIRKGIERAANWMLPALFVMLVIQVIFAMIWGDFRQGLAFLFVPDFSKITPDVALKALGQAFFSVGVGGVGTATFAAYLPKKISIPKYALATGAADVLVSLLAGLAIFPFVFKFNLPGEN